ncbi:2-oxoacid:acceptor oxidoreductase subunit alpha [Hyphobacterium sp.]|uniref:2-oxoacid:acceptor oxidoreductase subunit alpha n=1 Tax=Hyphobacterium sp. TaxID=2004662 RepID=UPI003BACEDDD
MNVQAKADASNSTEVKVNDFVIKIGNVNGTGSASANGLLMKSIFRMGIPVTGKNLFPSNIQGLPTWYEIRVSRDGWTARRSDVDLMVAMNLESYEQDLKSVSPGGTLLYDSTWPRPKFYGREDITVIGVPLARMTNSEFSNARTRVLMKNMAYVGAIAALTGLDMAAIRGLVEETFKAKPKLIAPNMKALMLGFDYIREHYDPLPLRFEPMDETKDCILIEGNDAAALGCVYAGATFGAWYPITPSTSLMDGFKAHCQKLRVDEETGKNNYCIIQAEDELSAAGMVIGASWNGARAFTPTSGPGISLMSEFIGFAYYAEVPSVFFDIQRVGPSTGMPTRTQQGDILLAAYASHGDTKHIVLFPADPKECFELSADAFDIAERFQTPVFVLSDLDIGMNEWMVPRFEWEDRRQPDRGKILNAEDLEKVEKFHRYLDVDGDGIPYRTIPGEHPKGAYFTRGSGHNKFGGYTEDSGAYQEVLDRILQKWKNAADHLPPPVINKCGKETSRAILTVGGCAAAIAEAVHQMAENGLDFDYLRVKAFPFHSQVEAFMEAYDQVFVVEQNRDGQLRQLLINETDAPKEKLIPILDYSGMPTDVDRVVNMITEHCQAES